MVSSWSLNGLIMVSYWLINVYEWPINALIMVYKGYAWSMDGFIMVSYWSINGSK